MFLNPLPLKINEFEGVVYTIWIKDGMPYKLISDKSLQKIVSTTYNIKKYEGGEDFNNLLPDNFTIKYKSFISIENFLNKPLPDLNYLSEFGDSIKLQDFKGKPMLIFFTGIGCKQCKNAYPLIDSLFAKFPTLKIIFAESGLTDINKIKEYKEKNKLIYPYIFINNTDIGAIGLHLLPTFALFNKDGNLVYLYEGYKSNSDFVFQINDEIDKIIK